MPDRKTYTGGCHCGQVRFECTTDLAMVTACNCSICTKKGLHFAFLAPKSFQLRAGEDNLKEYVFNRHAIRHQLCIDCGVDVFARGSKPDGTEVVALNVSCIDGIELATRDDADRWTESVGLTRQNLKRDLSSVHLSLWERSARSAG